MSGHQDRHKKRNEKNRPRIDPETWEKLIYLQEDWKCPSISATIAEGTCLLENTFLDIHLSLRYNLLKINLLLAVLYSYMDKFCFWTSNNLIN